MLDSKLRFYIDPPLQALADILVSWRIQADLVTLAGVFFSLCAFGFLALEAYNPALLMIVLSRFMDGLDGAVARRSSKGASDLGGFYDIVSDFIFYSGIIFFFAVGRPETALPAAFLLFSIMGSASSFLAYAILAAKREIIHEKQGQKSFYYVAGLCEGSETILFLVLMCLFPDFFIVLALVFSGLCWLTTGGRILLAAKNFS
ncbi:MAG: CDP-alcohol phosphatidyltransferase [Alphaproteobacteria bacterium CG_4_9_14_3_um_filter_47_13]|nr:MAG: CDP-alcohol phosphatidyltransferase [Alphaproteobacteria bacterium CG_4_9_14_3_um_filter_47_13]